MMRFENKTLNLALLVFGSCAASSCGDAEPGETAHELSAIVPEPEMEVRELTADELAAFAADPRMAPAVESAQFDALSPDYSSARLVTANNGLPGSETWVPLVDETGAGNGQSIVLQDGTGDPEVFFIDDILEVPTQTNTTSGALRQALFGCGSWSGWSYVQTYCGNRFWCFRYSQRGTWIQWQRTRQCRRGVQVDYRNAFQYCGC